jgi:hypothetical protein
MSKYTFKTIVATEEVRASFTNLRDNLNTSDKQLMQAFWNLCTLDMNNFERLKLEVNSLRETEALNKAAKRNTKAKKEPKVVKEPKAKKEEKEVKPRRSKEKDVEVKTVITTDEFGKDDVPCLVVDAS